MHTTDTQEDKVLSSVLPKHLKLENTLLEGEKYIHKCIRGNKITTREMLSLGLAGGHNELAEARRFMSTQQSHLTSRNSWLQLTTTVKHKVNEPGESASKLTQLLIVN